MKTKGYNMGTVTENPRNFRYVDRTCPECQKVYSGQSFQCKPCRAKVIKEWRQNNHYARKNAGAYTHVIRNEETKHIFKFSLLEGNIPNGYTVVYQAGPGELLPQIYNKEKAHHEQT